MKPSYLIDVYIIFVSKMALQRGIYRACPEGIGTTRISAATVSNEQILWFLKHLSCSRHGYIFCKMFLGRRAQTNFYDFVSCMEYNA